MAKAFRNQTRAAIVVAALLLASAVVGGFSRRSPVPSQRASAEADDYRPFPLTASGSFIVAAVSKEGIVLAADTRATFKGEDGVAFGYVDGLPKLFVINRNALATAGAATMNDDFLAYFVRRNQLDLLQPADRMLQRFFGLIPEKTRAGVMIISAGFVDEKPMICMKNPNRELCQDSGVIANKDSPYLREALPRFGQMSAIDTAAILKRAIANYGPDPTVGGPISILHISNTGAPWWLEGRPTDAPWPKICDMVRDYRAGRANVGMLSTRETLDRYFNAACPNL